MAATKAKQLLRRKLDGVVDEGQSMSIELPIRDAMDGSQYDVVSGQILDGGVLPSRSGEEAGNDPTKADLYGGISISGRPSSARYEAKLPNGKVAGMISAVGTVAVICLELKTLLGNVMVGIRVDSGMAVGSNGQFPNALGLF